MIELQYDLCSSTFAHANDDFLVSQPKQLHQRQLKKNLNLKFETKIFPTANGRKTTLAAAGRMSAIWVQQSLAQVKAPAVDTVPDTRLKRLKSFSKGDNGDKGTQLRLPNAISNKSHSIFVGSLRAKS